MLLLLLASLSSKQLLVSSVWKLNQFVVRADFDDSSLGRHSDEIGIADCGKSVSNDDSSALLELQQSVE